MTSPTEEEMSDPQQWDFDSAQVVKPNKSPGAVVSVRFSKDDLTAVSNAALERGMKTSEFIRSAAIEKATCDVRRPVIAISAVAGRNVKMAQPPANWQRTNGTGRFRLSQKLMGVARLGQTA